MTDEINTPGDKPRRKKKEHLPALRNPAKVRRGEISESSIEPLLDDLYRNRLWHLRQLIIINRGPKAVARMLNASDAYVTQIGGPNPTRRIGNDWAPRIEEAFHLKPGFLDSDPPVLNYTDERLTQICSTLMYASDKDKDFVLSMAQWLVSREMELPAGNTGIEINGKDVK